MRTTSLLLVALLFATLLPTPSQAFPLRHARHLQRTTAFCAHQSSTLHSSKKLHPLKTIHYRSRFAFLRRVVKLAVDPAHGKMTPNSKREGIIGVTLEAQGRLPAPITREPTGKSEFVDAKGVMWDVKGFNSHFPAKSGGFVLERAAAKILGQFRGGENVILDTKNLTPHDERALRHEVKRRGWSKRVIWFPR